MRIAVPRIILLTMALVIFTSVDLLAGNTTVTVRVINGKSGVPVKGAVVRLHGYRKSPYRNVGGSVTQKDVLFQDWTAKTDASGSVAFNMNEPTNSWPGHNGMAAGTVYHTNQPAKWLWGNVDGFWQCVQDPSDTAQATEIIVRQGVALPDRCDRKGKLKGRFTPKPGEWVMFVTPVSWWDRIPRPFFGKLPP